MFSSTCLLSGSSPQYSKGTYIPVFPTKERQSPWEGRITNTSDNMVTMGVTPSANCIVGKYHMYVAVATPHGIRRTRRDNSRDLYILFNPWVSGLFRFCSAFEDAELETWLFLLRFHPPDRVVSSQLMMCFWTMR